MRLLLLAHDHVSPGGPIADRFAQRGWDIAEQVVVPAESFHSPNVTASFDDPTSHDAIVVMGAPWSVFDTTSIGRWIGDELAMLATAHAVGVPVLGVCFGGQALAAALGGAVERSPRPEYGWHTLDTDRPELVPSGPWLQFHQDRWITPPGAVEFARTEHSPQAFVHGRSLAVQFHPETTPASLQGWYDNGGATYLSARGVDPTALMARTRSEEGAAAGRAALLVDNFLDRVATVSVAVA